MAAAVGSVIVGVAACRLVTVATAAAAPIRPAIFLSMISPVEYSPSRLAYNSFCGGMVPNVAGGFRSVGFAMAGIAALRQVFQGRIADQRAGGIGTENCWRKHGSYYPQQESDHSESLLTANTGGDKVG